MRAVFWSRVNKSGAIHPVYGQCWHWTGGKTKRYGKLRVNGKHTYAHRFSYWLHTKKKLPDHVCVLHKCDNPICVNPQHLFTGKQADNVVDRDLKNRQAKGEDNARSKLSSSEVQQIRKRYKPRHPTDGQVALAKEFGVQPLAIKCVVRKQTWRHL